MSCAGNGYLTGNMLVPFPLEDGKAFSWPKMVAESQLAFQRCIVDAGVHISGDAVSPDEWPAIGISGFDVQGQSVTLLLSACGQEMVVLARPEEKPFPVISAKTTWGLFVVVLSSEGMRDFLSFCSENSISPPASGSSSPSGWDGGYFINLCPKCVSVSPVGLSSIRVYDGVEKQSDGPHFVLKGDVVIKPGNNMLLSDAEDNGIEIGAVPGAGLGTVPCSCDDVAVVKSPIMSPDGHTRIFNDTCYDVEPRIETYVEDGKTRRRGILQLHAKCTACCTCAMYASIVNDRLAPLAALVRQAKSDLDGLLSSYESAVKRFNQRLTRPMLSDVRLSISGMPVGSNLSPKLSGTNVKGKMGRCAFTAILRNSSYSVISATVYSLTGSDTVVEASASWTDRDGAQRSRSGNSSSDIVGKTFSIGPGMSLVVTFVSVKNDMVGAAKTGGYSGSISVGLSYSSEGGPSGSLGILRKSVEV